LVNCPRISVEQYTLFFEAPSGNALEFKAFADINNINTDLFAT